MTQEEGTSCLHIYSFHSENAPFKESAPEDMFSVGLKERVEGKEGEKERGERGREASM